MLNNAPHPLVPSHDPTEPASPTWKGIRALERAYGLTHGQIHRWIRRGLIPPSAIPNPDHAGQPRLIDETVLQQVFIAEHRPRSTPATTRTIIIQPATPGAPLTQLSAQVLAPHAPISSLAPLTLPSGYSSTAELVTSYLQLRALAVARGSIKQTTFDLDKLYMTKWALHTPAFPWTQTDIDSYDASLGTRPSRWHAMRYLRALSKWTMRRFPDLRLPTHYVVGTSSPPRHDVLTTEQETSILQAFREWSHTLWIFSTVLTRTGCRGFELLDTDWPDIEHRGFVTHGRAKKRAGTVYFSNGVYELIHTLPQPHDGAIFQTPDGLRYTAQAINRHMNQALRTTDIHGYSGPIGSYMFRHLYAQRMKDRISLARLAPIMRTSIEQLENTYGKHTDQSFRDIIDTAHSDVWSDDPLATT